MDNGASKYKAFIYLCVLIVLVSEGEGERECMNGFVVDRH